MTQTHAPSFHDHVQHLRTAYSGAVQNAARGQAFERLAQAYFRADPVYQEHFAAVYTWQEWQEANPGNRTGDMFQADDGIDLVAELRHPVHAQQPYAAIQCKCYTSGQKIDKQDVMPLITASGAPGGGGGGGRQQHHLC